MSDPKNKWTRPAAPPAPMFFGEKERNLVKQVNDELAERVLGQTIAYYPISIEESNFNDIYGEAQEKVALPPVRVFAYVVVENEQSNVNYGYEYQTKLTVNFHRRRLVEDQNLFVRVGDFIQYGEFYYEIVRTYNDTRYYFGQVEHKFQISAECVRARQGVLRVMPEIDRPTLAQQEATDASNPPAREAPYPPLAATYITLNAETKLPNERVLTAGTGITITDSGAGAAVTVASTVAAAGPTGSIQFQQGSGIFTGSANLTFLSSTGRLGINTSTPDVTLEIGTSSADNSPAIRFTGLRPRIQFYETDQSTQYQIQASNGMLKWQVQNNDFDDANVKWIMNSDGNMAFRDGAAGEPIPARIYVSGSGNSNLLQISSSTAANILVVTGSGKVGIGTDDPSHTLTVTGSISGSGIAYFGDDLYIAGTLYGGSPLKIAGAIEIYDTVNGNGVIASMGDTTGTGENSISASCLLASDLTASFALLPNIVSTTQISASTVLAGSSLWNDITCSSFMSSSLYYGDGRYLTNVTASAITTGDGPVGSLQFRVDNPISNEISGTVRVLYDVANNSLKVDGGLAHNRTSVSTSYTASSGNYILGVSSAPTEILFDATGFDNGQVVIVKDESGNASAINLITLNPSGSQTIDGSNSAHIESPYGSVFLYTDGSDWFIY